MPGGNAGFARTQREKPQSHFVILALEGDLYAEHDHAWLAGWYPLTRQHVHRILATLPADDSVGREPKIYDFAQQTSGHYLTITGPSDKVVGRLRVSDGDARKGDLILEQTALVVIDELAESGKGDYNFSGHVDWERTRAHWNRLHGMGGREATATVSP